MGRPDTPPGVQWEGAGLPDLVDSCWGAGSGRQRRWVAPIQVDKLLGPGNQYVTAAKMLAQNSEAMVSIDMPAGPSEVLVIADAGAPPAHVAADLLSQAEHGPDSQVWHLTPVSPTLSAHGITLAAPMPLACL